VREFFLDDKIPDKSAKNNPVKIRGKSVRQNRSQLTEMQLNKRLYANIAE
jgi:hypothetical protein